MIAVDTNILVYAHRKESPFHHRARQVMIELAEGRVAWAIPWTCLHEFVGLVTHPRIFVPATPLSVAVEQVDIWLGSPSLSLLGENEGHWNALKGCVTAAKVTGPMIHDARIAAICVSHGVRELWTADRDFSRFRGLAVRNPLI
jgi:toxin-antitoxin system PIN domain toxin